MRFAGYVPAAILILVGAIFTGQGLGFIPGSFMTGSGFWAVVGIVMLVAGGALAVAISRQPPG